METRSVILLSILICIVSYLLFSPYISLELFAPKRHSVINQFLSDLRSSQAFDHRAYWQLRDQYGMTDGRFSVKGVDPNYATRIQKNISLSEGTAIYAMEGNRLSAIDYTVPQILTFDQIESTRVLPKGEVIFRRGHILVEVLPDSIVIQALLPIEYMAEVQKFFYFVDHPYLVKERNWYTAAVFVK